jgi:hypothetical protein
VRKGGELTGPNRVDRGKSGSKYHVLVTADGLPLNIAVSGANRHGSIFVAPILDSMPAIRAPAAAIPGADRSSCTRTRATTTSSCGPGSDGEGSPRGSPAAAWKPARGSAGTAGSSNAPLTWLTWLTGYRRADPALRALRQRSAKLFTVILALAAAAHLLQEAVHVRQALSRP